MKRLVKVKGFEQAFQHLPQFHMRLRIHQLHQEQHFRRRLSNKASRLNPERCLLQQPFSGSIHSNGRATRRRRTAFGRPRPISNRNNTPPNQRKLQPRRALPPLPQNHRPAPAPGDAADDETCYEPEQQGLGRWPSKPRRRSRTEPIGSEYLIRSPSLTPRTEVRLTRRVF